MNNALATRLTDVLQKADLDYTDLARILDLNPRTVSRWANTAAQPRREYRERLLEFFAVMERLQQVVDPSFSHDWLFTPNAALSDEKPVELLRRGDFRKVLGVIDAIGEGAYS